MGKRERTNNILKFMRFSPVGWAEMRCVFFSSGSWPWTMISLDLGGFTIIIVQIFRDHPIMKMSLKMTLV